MHGPHIPFSVHFSVPSKQPGVPRYDGSPLKQACAWPPVQEQVSSTRPSQSSSSPRRSGSQSSVGPHSVPHGLTNTSSFASDPASSIGSNPPVPPVLTVLPAPPAPPVPAGFVVDVEVSVQSK